MLTHLSIRDVVVIDRLDLPVSPGLTTFTGETGAGKSIILDALGLVLGARGERDLIRAGADSAQVVATFALSPGVADFLHSNDLPVEDPLVVRRVLRATGGGAYINDAPVSVGLLRTLGAMLVEIHGQRDSHALLGAGAQRQILDDFGAAHAALMDVQHAWQALRTAQDAHDDLITRRDQLDEARARMADSLAALDRLAPQPDEERALADEKALLALAETLTSELQAVTAAMSDDMSQRLAQALRGLARTISRVERSGAAVPERLQAAVAACERVIIEADEATRSVNDIARAFAHDPQRLQEVDDRLHALRSAARRCGVSIDDLGAHRADLARQLAALDDFDAQLADAARALHAAQHHYDAAAATLSAQRQQAAVALAAHMQSALPGLKLDKVTFAVDLPPCPAGPEGVERVVFMARTNPDQPMGPIASMASGGEFARFALALKAAQADRGAVATLIFDEVDQGVGGAVAEAVGKRLADLAARAQVLVVTHSPQVAARGHTQVRVEKTIQNDQTRTTARVLLDDERREEIARMLAGEVITDAARAAADALMERA